VPKLKPPLAKRLFAPPPAWSKDVQNLLISEKTLARRVCQLAREIQNDFKEKDGDFIIISILNGTVCFLPDLIRHITLPLKLDFIGVSSYQSGTQSGRLRFTKKTKLNLQGSRILLVDDILDTGNTLSRVIRELKKSDPKDIRTCVLLDKPERRITAIEPDYVGFTVPNYFVVGYGLDYAQQYRHLPFICVLRPEIYGAKQHQVS